MKFKLNLSKWVTSEPQVLTEPIQSTPEPVLATIPIEGPKIFFSDFFRSQTEYDWIMSIMANEKLCSPSTFLWSDHNAGYKGELVRVIKFIHIQGYLKENKELSVCEIRTICKNTFGVSLCPSTVMHNKPSTLSYIPRSKTFRT